MSEENVEIVREAYSRYSEGGFPAMMELASTDIEIEVSDVMPDMGRIQGREAAEPLFRSYAEMFDDFRITLEEVIASDGKKVVTAVRDGGRIKGSDAEVRNRFFHVFTIRNGKIAGWSSHVERSRALEAAGLSEQGDTAQVVSERHQTIQHIYEAFGRRDLDAIVSALDEDAMVDFTKTIGPEGGVYPGPEGIEKLLDTYWDAFDQISIAVEEFIDGPNGTIAVVVARGRGQGSGASVEARGPHLWTFREARPIRFTLYQDTAEALEAAGLSE